MKKAWLNFGNGLKFAAMLQDNEMTVFLESTPDPGVGCPAVRFSGFWYLDESFWIVDEVKDGVTYLQQCLGIKDLTAEMIEVIHCKAMIAFGFMPSEEDLGSFLAGLNSHTGEA